MQDIDRESVKYIKTDNHNPSCAGENVLLYLPASNLNLISDIRLTGTYMDIFVPGVKVGLIHTEKLLSKKLKTARQTGNLKIELDNRPNKSNKRRVVGAIFK